jgi:hypothetical protein
MLTLRSLSSVHRRIVYARGYRSRTKQNEETSTHRTMPYTKKVSRRTSPSFEFTMVELPPPLLLLDVEFDASQRSSSGDSHASRKEGGIRDIWSPSGAAWLSSMRST